MSAYRDLFSESKCLSRDQLVRYVYGKPDKEEIFLIESHLTDCELCSAAIDGLMERPESETLQELKKMKDQWEEKYNQLPKNNKTVLKATPSKNRWMIAASVIMLLGLAGFSVYSYYHHEKGNIAKTEENKPSFTSHSSSDQEIKQIRVSPDDLKNSEKEAQIKVTKEDRSKSVVTQSNQTEVSAAKQNKTEFSPPPVKAINIQEHEAADGALATLETPSSLPEENVIKEKDHLKEEMKAPQPATEIRKNPVGGLSNGYKNATSKYSPVLNQSNYYGQDNNYNQNVQPSYNSKKILETVSLTSLQEGIQLYQKGSFKKSIKMLKRSLDQSTGAELEDSHYYLALAYTQLGDHENAAVHYNWIKNIPRYSDVANKALIQSYEVKAKKK